MRWLFFALLSCAACETAGGHAAGDPDTGPLPTPVCGNRVIESGETCDGNFASCASLSKPGDGQAACRADCSGFETGNCVAATATCGNGVTDAEEACDGNTWSCWEIGAGDVGMAYCTTDCSGIDTNECQYVCVPDCADAECGDDFCNGSCGTCRFSTACDAARRCVTTAFGSVTGSLMFETLVADFDDSGQVELVQGSDLAAKGMVAVVYDAFSNVIGYAQVEAEGRFSVPVVQSLVGSETLLFSTMWAPSLEDYNPTLVVAQAYTGGVEGSVANLRPWTWQASVPRSGQVGDLRIPTSEGSGAAYIFLFTLSAMQTIAQDIGNGDTGILQPLTLLWAPGGAWNCGSCYSGQIPQYLNGAKASDQSIFISGAYGGASAWGWPVILHEFGHYVAKNYSRDNSPGGFHYICGSTTSPPFAWSEGWAGFYAVATMSRWLGQAYPYFWDIQEGTSFWMNYASGVSNAASPPFALPNASSGIAQDLDEAWVATMLWHLWDGVDIAEPAGDDDGTYLGTPAVLSAISSNRFLYSNRGATGADFIDFVDAVACSWSYTAEGMTNTLNTYLSFPYDGAPLCP